MSEVTVLHHNDYAYVMDKVCMLDHTLSHTVSIMFYTVFSITVYIVTAHTDFEIFFKISDATRAL